MMALTSGAIEGLNLGRQVNSPTVQIIDVKKIHAATGERHRLILSDGCHFMQAMLATQQNNLVDSGELRKFSVVTLNEHLCNVVQNRKIIIVLNLRVVSSPDSVIGNPARLEEGGAPPAANGAQEAQHHPQMAQHHQQHHQQHAQSYGQNGAHSYGQNGQPPPQQYPQQNGQPPPRATNHQPPQHHAAPPYAQNGAPPYQQQQQPPYNGQPQQQQQPPHHPHQPSYGGQQQQQHPPHQQSYAPPPQQHNQPPPYNQPSYGGQHMQQQQQQHGYGPPGAQQQQQQAYGMGGYGQNATSPPMGGSRYRGGGCGGGGGANGQPSTPVHQCGGPVISPVERLNPYQNRWVVRVRVLNKNYRTYSNAKGEGKLFNMDVADASGDIRMTAFNQEVDSFYEQIEVGQCYQISGGTLKQANRAFNKTSHQFEVTLNRSSQVEPITEAEGAHNIPRQSFNFVTFDRLENVPDDSYVDVIGVIKEVDEEPLTYTNKNGKEVTKRVMQLVDRSNKGVEVTFFGTEASDSRLRREVVMTIKGAKVSSWNTKSLACFGGAAFEINPDMPEAHNLMGWWANDGRVANHQLISVAGSAGAGVSNAQRISFAEIDERALGLNSTPDFFSVSCTITHIKTDKRTLWYIACPTCKKKVAGADEQVLDGMCEKCNKPVTGQRRWIFSALCNDATGCRYISFFDEMGLKLLGKTADEMAPLKEQEPSTEFDQHFLAKSFQRCVMKCSAKMDTYNDEQRIKLTCASFAPIDFVEEGRAMMRDIRAMLPPR